MDVKGTAHEVLMKQKLDKISELEAKFKVVVTVEEVTLGDLADLTDNQTPFKERLASIQKMLVEGQARDIRMVDLDQFMEIITLKMETRANPTSAR